MTVIIRDAHESDKEMYFRMASDFYSTDAVLHNIPKENFENFFNTVIEGSPFAKLYILELDKKPVGYASIAVTYTTEAGGKTLWLDELYITEGFRGMGIGRELIRYLKSDPSVKRIRLEITSNNERAKKLYLSEGFYEADYSQLMCDL